MIKCGAVTVDLQPAQSQLFGRRGPTEAQLGLDPDFKEVDRRFVASHCQRPVAVARGRFGVPCLQIVTGQLAL